MKNKKAITMFGIAVILFIVFILFWNNFSFEAVGVNLPAGLEAVIQIVTYVPSMILILLGIVNLEGKKKKKRGK